MPQKAPRICRCGYRIAAGAQCMCERRDAAARKARHDGNRPSASKRGYGRRWQTERAKWLRTYPWCRMCGAPATVVDHIVPHKGDDDLFWDVNNWQSLCRSCHNSTKQSQEKRAPGGGHQLSEGRGNRRAGSRANSSRNRDFLDGGADR